jgi:hypothetical protein
VVAAVPALPVIPIRFIIIDPQLHRPPVGGNFAGPFPWDHKSNQVILSTLKNYTLMEVYSAATRDLPQGRHARTPYGALRDPPADSPDGRPSAANIVELFDAQQVNGWLRMSRAEPVTCAVVLSRPDPGRNTPQPNGKYFLNLLDFYDDAEMSDPAKESDSDIRPKNSSNRVMLKNRPGLEKCMTLVRNESHVRRSFYAELRCMLGPSAALTPF